MGGDLGVEELVRVVVHIRGSARFGRPPAGPQLLWSARDLQESTRSLRHLWAAEERREALQLSGAPRPSVGQCPGDMETDQGKHRPDTQPAEPCPLPAAGRTLLLGR